ncbi:MAG: LPS export ABC transporter periplasmic protein LptC [Pseudomonadota bacterium]
MTGGHQVHWLPLALAALLAMLALWLNQLTHRPAHVDDGGFEHTPDTIVEDFQALAFDQAGQPLHRLSAARLTHYLDDDTTELEQPRFSVLDKDSARVEVTARRGQVSSNGQHVHLLGDVHMSRQGQGAKAPITLDTDYLWITPDAGVMRTDKPVTVRQGQSTISAGGMLAYNQRKEVTLSGGVRGNYEQTR